ncbi:hypothetical protein HQQ80_07005 [Microbacteriaceae bacterium VKM Ac-2855]|nr:hypothetical protein [Microbacteriaceae bacterium VKM Ac-2855]
MNGTDLDALKSVVWRTTGTIEGVQDAIAGNIEGVDLESESEILDSCRRMLWLALAERVEGIRWDGLRVTFTDLGWAMATTYTDGSPVYEDIDLGIPGYGPARYFPRHDGDRAAFIKLVTPPKRHLHVVPPAPEDSPYLALADMLRASGHRTLGEAHAAGLFSKGTDA